MSAPTMTTTFTGSPADPQLARRLAVALDAIDAAAAATLRYFGDPALAVTLKQDHSPVTEADREAERILRDRLLEAFPEDGFLGEESGLAAGRSGFDWVVDPIDGTKSFIRGVPLFATLVGCRREGRGVIGVIAIPALGELAYAAAGGGCWHARRNPADPAALRGEPRAARVSSAGSLAESLWCTSATTTFAKQGRDAARERLDEACGLARTWGDGYGYLLVATGRAELMVDAEMHPWDAAAVETVVREAGGRFTDWKGEERIDGGCGLATNGLIHEAALAILHEPRRRS